MVELADLHKLRLTNDLIQAGLRLSIIRGMTDVGIRTLRQWWKDIHGVRPPNGKLPESVISYIKDKDSATRLSAFAALYKRLYGLELTPENLLTAWREYQLICGPVDINAAYYSVRDVRAKIVSLTVCKVCGATYIYHAEARHTDRCPFCDTRPNFD